MKLFLATRRNVEKRLLIISEKQKEEKRLQKVREKELNDQPYVETWAEKRSPRVAAVSPRIVVKPEDGVDSISPRIMSAPNSLQLPDSSDR